MTTLSIYIATPIFFFYSEKRVSAFPSLLGRPCCVNLERRPKPIAATQTFSLGGACLGCSLDFTSALSDNYSEQKAFAHDITATILPVHQTRYNALACGERRIILNYLKIRDSSKMFWIQTNGALFLLSSCLKE